MLSREQIAEYYSRGKQIGDLAEYRALSKSQQIVQESLGYVYSNYPCMLKEPINYTVLLGIWATLLDERDIYPTEADYDARRKVMNFVGEVNKGVIPYISSRYYATALLNSSPQNDSDTIPFSTKHIPSKSTLYFSNTPLNKAFPLLIYNFFQLCVWLIATSCNIFRWFDKPDLLSWSFHSHN